MNQHYASVDVGDTSARPVAIQVLPLRPFFSPHDVLFWLLRMASGQNEDQKQGLFQRRWQAADPWLTQKS